MRLPGTSRLSSAKISACHQLRAVILLLLLLLLVSKGQISRFQPALKYVEKGDTVAVAHWCDDGRSNLDLMPTRNVEDVSTTLEHVLAPGPDTKYADRAGELALQSTLQQIDAGLKLSSLRPYRLSLREDALCLELQPR